jgi:asparaginyl-tRNA synthetase
MWRKKCAPNGHLCQIVRSFGSERKRLPINEARRLDAGSHISVAGWVKSVRKHKSVSFVSINDGSCLAEMQITIPLPTEEKQNVEVKVDLDKITVGSSISVYGTLQEIPGKQKKLEILPNKLTVLGACDTQEYPLQKKYHSLEFLRSHLHLRARTNTIGAVTRVRNALSQGLHHYFQDNGFLHLHTPILTSNDCEGAGEQFKVVKENTKGMLCNLCE